MMTARKIIVLVMGALLLIMGFASCSTDDDNWDLVRPTALVTVYPTSDSFTMQLDDETSLVPANVKKSPFGDKTVRALVNYTDDAGKGNMRPVTVNWIDSIRTKEPVQFKYDDKNWGNDPIEIINDWVTVAEDGFLTLRVRTLWGNNHLPHTINLVSGMNPDDPYEFRLCHDANGDMASRRGDALIAFNLNNMGTGGQPRTITIKWRSFSGEKSAQFKLNMHAQPAVKIADAQALRNNLVK